MLQTMSSDYTQSKSYTKIKRIAEEFVSLLGATNSFQMQQLYIFFVFKLSYVFFFLFII